jgi:hypothetical protein
LSFALFASALLLLPAAAMAQSGDPNLDGDTNVLDVQATVAQVLGSQAPSTHSDIDGNGNVDIFDVQHMINTALRVGGLFQVVEGRIMDVTCQENARYVVIAVSRNGRRVEAPVDCETGLFRLRLRTRTAWALALCLKTQNGEQEQTQVIAIFRFRLGDRDSGALPVPGLGRGEVLQLGDLIREQNRIRAQHQIQELLGALQPPLDHGDQNGNGVPDIIEPLLERLREGAPGLPVDVDLQPLYPALGDCVRTWMEAGITPSPVDENANGIPDFLEPLRSCLETALVDWLTEIGVNIPPGDHNNNGTSDYIESLVHHIMMGVPDWLQRIGRPELRDENGNGIADQVEALVSMPGFPTPVDNDGDGIPDFAQDADADGIPNCVDPDYSRVGDQDGDGVPDANDEDADGNGIPDYAEAV